MIAPEKRVNRKPAVRAAEATLVANRCEERGACL